MLYVLLGVVAVVLLVTAYWSSHQALHQVGVTVALIAMLAVNAASVIREKGFSAYYRTAMRQDIVVLVIWALLLVIWIIDPQP